LDENRHKRLEPFAADPIGRLPNQDQRLTHRFVINPASWARTNSSRIRPFSKRPLHAYRPAMAATSSSRVVMLTCLISAAFQARQCARHPDCRARPVCNLARIGTGELHLIVDSTGLKLRGAGEWLFEKHGTTKRRAWRKLHIGIDAGNGEIVAFDLTDKDVDDA